MNVNVSVKQCVTCVDVLGCYTVYARQCSIRSVGLVLSLLMLFVASTLLFAVKRVTSFTVAIYLTNFVFISVRHKALRNCVT